jgi:hypothetical protein
LSSDGQSSSTWIRWRSSSFARRFTRKRWPSEPTALMLALDEAEPRVGRAIDLAHSAGAER